MPKNVARRRILERLWIFATLAYSIGRVILARATVERYGVNIWVFGFIDFGTSGPYGLATARLVTSLIDKNTNAASRWAALAGACFIAPDLYVVASGRDLPPRIYVVLSVWVSLMTALSIGQMRRRIRTNKISAGES